MDNITTKTQHRTTLVVDSDLDVLNEMRDYTERHAVSESSFRFVKNVKEAMTEIEKGGVNLVVLELILPVLNGYYLLGWLNKNHPEVAVLIYTRVKGEGDFDRLATFKIENILHKNSIKPADLILKIQKGDSFKVAMEGRLIELKTNLKNDEGTSVQQKEKVVKCPKCGVVLNRHSRFCNNCGHRLVVAQPVIKNKP